eukprot:30011-Chlamydomonas_euryale.AAC.6
MAPLDCKAGLENLLRQAIPIHSQYVPHPLKGPFADHELRRGRATSFKYSLKPVVVSASRRQCRGDSYNEWTLLCPSGPPHTRILTPTALTHTPPTPLADRVFARLPQRAQVQRRAVCGARPRARHGAVLQLRRQNDARDWRGGVPVRRAQLRRTRGRARSGVT